MSEPPRVKPFKVDYVHVYIICPHCHRVHAHGAAGGHYWGGRASHCTTAAPDYIIERNPTIEEGVWN